MNLTLKINYTMNTKKMILPVAVTAMLFATAFSILSDNGKAGYTGSQGELVCNDCHGTFGNSNTGSGTIYLTSSMNNWQYVPGQTYTVSVVVRQPGKPLFGFGCEALTASHTNAGTIQVTNAAKTQIKTKTVSGVTRNNIVHQFNGGLSNDSAVFTFNWQAPATNVGNVTFYFAGVAANNDGSEDNDYVYNSTKLVTPASATGLTEVNKNKTGLKSYVNSNGDLVLNYQSNDAASPRVDLYDIGGKLIASRRFEMQSTGKVELLFQRPLELTSGMYLVNLFSGSELYCGKIQIP